MSTRSGLNKQTNQTNGVNMTDMKAIVQALGAKLEPGAIKERKGHGGAMLAYIDWTTVADMLDEVYPEWSWHIDKVIIEGTTVAVVGGIIINGITRQGLGASSNEHLAFDDQLKSAETDALKRAAVRWGIGRELYRDDTPSGNPRSRSDFERAAQADAAGDDPMLATPKQLAMIHAICKGLGKDAEKGANYYHQTSLGKLSRAQASEFITTLKALQAAQLAGVK